MWCGTVLEEMALEGYTLEVIEMLKGKQQGATGKEEERELKNERIQKKRENTRRRSKKGRINEGDPHYSGGAPDLY